MGMKYIILKFNGDNDEKIFAACQEHSSKDLQINEVGSFCSGIKFYFNTLEEKVEFALRWL